MYIVTYTGVEFDPTNPLAKDVRIQDIAHALSNQCRFTGHTRWFYSVAEHCLRASFIVPQEHALAALLHDASEAYVVDVPTPIKHDENMRWFRRMEKTVQAAIGEHFHLDFKQHADAIKWADNVMLASEARDLMRGCIVPSDCEMLDSRIIPMVPQQAKNEFLRRYFQLRPLT